MYKINYLRVTDESSEREHLRTGFIDVYKEAFGGPPYFETYTDEDVLNKVWSPHLAKGIIVLALESEKVVGLGCAKPVSEAPPEDQIHFRTCREDGSLPGNIDTLWYMSELAVLTSYRRQGIGCQLIAQRLESILALGGDRYSLRTASQGSNSVRTYISIGAVQLRGTVDVSKTDQVQVNQSKSLERIFFYGFCREAIERIRRRSVV